MGTCDRCGKEEYALFRTAKKYPLLCGNCYCTLYRDCVNECSNPYCPNDKKAKKTEYKE